MTTPDAKIPRRSEKPRKKKAAWSPILLVYVYKHAKAGLSDEAIARVLSVSRNGFKQWKARKQEVRDALALARAEKPAEDGFARYFYQQLDRPLQELWDKIQNNDRTGGGIALLDGILADHGRRARQSLFLHALVNSHFSPTRAMEKVGVDKRQLDDWVKTDPEFAELVDEIQWHKGNFFEESLMKLVEEGNAAAVVFANKTFNRRRGYGVAADLNVHVEGSVEHRHVLDLDDLDLDQETRIKIAEAVRRKEDERERSRMIGRMPADERAVRQVEDLIVRTMNPDD